MSSVAISSPRNTSEKLAYNLTSQQVAVWYSLIERKFESRASFRCIWSFLGDSMYATFSIVTSPFGPSTYSRQWYRHWVWLSGGVHISSSSWFHSYFYCLTEIKFSDMQYITINCGEQLASETDKIKRSERDITKRILAKSQDWPIMTCELNMVYTDIRLSFYYGKLALLFSMMP